MSIDGTTNYFPLTINGLQDISTDSQSVNILQVNSLTPNRVVVSDGSNYLTSAGATSTEIDYLIGTSSNVQNQINSKASTTYLDTNFLNKTTATQQNITPFCNFNSIGATTVGMSNGLQWYKNSPFMHAWTITRRIGTGSILKDMAFVDNENGVDTLLLSEDGQTVFVALTCNYATASKIPIFDASKKLVSSGVDSIKITYLDNVSSDIQTQLNGKLNLSGNNANQDIVISGYKVQSSATPTIGNDYTNKTYVDGQISGLGSVYLPLAGGVMTGDITGASFNYLRWGRSGDVRNNLAPNYVPGASMAWYFGTYANDNTGSFADHIIPNGWVDSSGGLTNMLSLNKGGKGIRQFQQTYGSSSGFATWYDCVLTDANSADVSIGGVLTAPTVNVSGQTASRVCVFDASKNVVSSSVSSTTLTYLDIGSSLTGLLNLKANLSGGNTFTGDQVINSGSLSISSRLLGTPDGSPSGNFWIGLRGTGTEIQRLAIGINGDQTTGVVSFVSIPKTLNLGSLTANRVLILDASNNVGSSTVSTTTLSYLDATSSVQNQLNAKANLAGGNVFTGFQTLSDETASRVVVLDAIKRLRASSTTMLELSYLSGVTSSLQPQLDGKVSDSGDTMTGELKFVNNVITEWGVGITKEPNAGKIGYGWVTTGSLDIVGGGTVVNERLVSLYDQIATGKATSNVSNAYASRASNPLPSNFIASSTSQRLYMGSYYTAGQGACSTIQASDFYSSADHGDQLLLNPLGGVVGIGASNPHLNWAGTAIPNAKLTILGGVPVTVGGKARISLGADSDHYSAIEAEHTGSGGTTLTFFTCKTAFVNGSNPTERLKIDEDGQMNSGVGGNTIYNLKFANSASHLDNNVGEVYLFTAYQGHIGVQRNTTRNASTACLTLGTSPLEKSEILSIRTDNATYMPLEYYASLHNFAVGNVGIGTTSPSAPLHVYNATGGVVGDFQVGNTNANYFDIRTNGTAGRMFIGMDNSIGGGLFGGNSAYMGWVGMPNSANLGFATNNTERMRILANGNVGIRTTAPAATLDILGNLRAIGSSVGGPSIITSENTAAGDAYAIFNCRANNGGGSYWFQNSSTRAGDGGANCATLRNDVGDMRLQSAGGQGITVQATTGVCFHSAGDGSYMRYGPNASWGSYLHVGATTNKVSSTDTGQLILTNGNVHIDASYDHDIYLGSYANVAGRVGTNRFYGDTKCINRFTVGDGSSRTLMTVGGGSNGVLPGLFGNIANWPDNANGCLYTQTLPSGANSAGMFVGYNSIGTTGYITSLAPSVAWCFIQIWAAETYIYYYGALSAYTGGGGWINVSDEREKEDIQPLKTEKSLERVMALRPKHYRRKFNENSATPIPEAEKQKRHVGFIAQEVQKSNPHCISTWCNKDAIKKKDEVKVEIDVDEDEEVKVEIDVEEDEEDDGSRLGMMYNDITVHLVGAVQEQQRMISEQQKKIELLSQRNQILEDRLVKLEQLLEKNGLM